MARLLALLSIAFLGLPAGASGPPSPGRGLHWALIPPGQTKSAILATAARLVPTAGQLAWQKMEFIAFAHFGINTFTDREWGDGTEDPALFNPSAFDARQWVRVLKAAGAGMLILTAKHHDGFCLWPSRLTDHSVRRSPWRDGRGDLVREVTDACREAGLKAGIYLSPWDRHEPSYGDSPAYNEHFRGQLRELLSDYGEIAEVWFDGACGEGPNGKRQEYDWPSYYRLVRELQPGAVIFGMGPDIRWVGTESGYGRETEWSVVPVGIRKAAVPAARPTLDDVFLPGDMTAVDLGSREKLREAKALAWYPAETDVSIRPGWFYHAKEDGSVKSPEALLDIYFRSVGCNSVLLLNVPPDRRGLIHENDAAVLRDWRRRLEAIFETDLAAGAEVKSTGAAAGRPDAALVDRDPLTYWEAAPGKLTATFEIDLRRETAFDTAMLQEYIRRGQRVEEFSLQAWTGTGWTALAAGTTIGYKRLLSFPAVTARRLRLVISGSRAEAALSGFGLYDSGRRP